MRLAPCLALLVACDPDCMPGYLQDNDGSCVLVDDTDAPPSTTDTEDPPRRPPDTTPTDTTPTSTTPTTTTPTEPEPECTEPVLSSAVLHGDDGGFDHFGIAGLTIENRSSYEITEIYVTACGTDLGENRMTSGTVPACSWTGGSFYMGCLDVVALEPSGYGWVIEGYLLEFYYSDPIVLVD